MNVAQNTAPLGNVSENRHAAIFGVGVGFIAFDSIIIALRIYVRAFMLRALGADDSKSMEPNERHDCAWFSGRIKYNGFTNKVEGEILA